MPQGKFGPLHLTERRGRLKDAHRKEQHEQSVPDTLQRGIDLDDQRPDVAALEALRRGRQQRPNLGKSAVPAIQRIFQCSYDPVIADRKSRIIKTILKGVVLIISPFLEKLYCRSSYLLYNQNKHCGFVIWLLQLRLFGGDSNRSGLSELVISWVTLDVLFA